jgi:hypothetical protein
MPGLDPGIHQAAKPSSPYVLNTLKVIMDGRVKPGHDKGSCLLAKFT